MTFTSIDPSLIPSIAIIAAYRRPTLVWNSITSVGIERGFSPNVISTINAAILFPDGTLRNDSNSNHIDFNITRNAIFNGVNQSGLRTGQSESVNTWYAMYAVKEQNGTGFVLVGDVNPPSRGNIPALNSFYGTNGWLYLGYIRNGDNSGATGDILAFVQVGYDFMFFNAEVDMAGHGGIGTRLVASTNQVNTWAFTPGMGVGGGGTAIDVPGSIIKAKFWCGASNTGATLEYIGGTADGTRRYFDITSTTGNRELQIVDADPAQGFRTSASQPVGSGSDINLYGWSDHALSANWSAQGSN